MLACERHGSGEPLVLIHGLTHRRQIWYPVLDRLVEHREVILVDLPGHGESPPLVTNGRHVEVALRDEFTQFLDDQGLDRPHVGGNSLGGRVGLEAAVVGYARSVTALSPAGFWRTDAAFNYTRRIFYAGAALVERYGPHAERLVRSRAGRSLIFGVLMSHPARVPVDHAIEDIRGFHAALPVVHALLPTATQFCGEVPLSVPVTIAWGARDLLLPPWQAQVAREALPHAEHVTLHGAGHVPMYDSPEQVARVLLRGSAPVGQVTPLAFIGMAPSRRRAASA